MNGLQRFLKGESLLEPQKAMQALLEISRELTNGSQGLLTLLDDLSRRPDRLARSLELRREEIKKMLVAIRLAQSIADSASSRLSLNMLIEKATSRKTSRPKSSSSRKKATPAGR